MKVIESRVSAEGYRRRRYEDPKGVRSTTIEVPLDVWQAVISCTRSKDRAAEVVRARKRFALQGRAVRHWLEGWKAIASAHELNVPVRTVQRWRLKARKTQMWPVGAPL